MYRIAATTMRMLLVAGLFGLVSCASPTPYQPMTDGQGYGQQQLEEDRYRVTFSGNTATPRETVENYLLYRAAEVTVERGYDYFVLADMQVERNTVYHATGFGIGSFGRSCIRCDGWGTFGGLDSGTFWPSSNYEAYANIVMGRGEKPADNADAYDARAVLQRLEGTLLRSPAR